MTTKVSGGGGGSIPGITPDGLIPPGIKVAGNVQLGEFPGSQTTIRPNSISVSRSNDNDVALDIGLALGSSGEEVSMTSPGGTKLYEFTAEGGLRLVSGLAVFGGSIPSTPRTLAQATITAITDANAKAAIQAIANALSDMGALTLT